MIARRIAFIPAGVLIVVTLSFWLVNLIPSDPASAKAGDNATPERLAQIRADMGLDQPVIARYGEYMRDLILHGDLGTSYYTGRDVIDDLGEYLPNTIELAVLAIVVAAVFGIGLGTLSAYFQRRAPDHLARGFVALTQAIPDFFLGLVLIFVLFYVAGVVPAPTGRLGLLDSPPPTVTNGLFVDSILAGQWETLRSAAQHAILPVLTLGVAYSAYFAKTTRSALGRALNSHQAEFARASGLPERKVLMYAFRVARTPILTFAGMSFASLLGGAAIVEVVFSWGGLGQFAVERIQQLDLPEIQGIILVLALITLTVYMIVDILVLILDRRVSYE